MSYATHTDKLFKSFDGKEIFYRVWNELKSSNKKALIIVHRGHEHSARMQHIVDELGLDYIDRKLLLTIIDKFNGGPVGLDTLSAATGEESNTIEDVYEPYLIMNGFINRTPRGRVATELAYKHLGIIQK